MHSKGSDVNGMTSIIARHWDRLEEMLEEEFQAKMVLLYRAQRAERRFLAWRAIALLGWAIIAVTVIHGFVIFGVTP